jgi:hypothetical protein
VASGPYLNYGKNNNSTAWGVICKYCGQEFISTSTNIEKVKSCYSCRGNVRKVVSEETTLKHLYSGIKGRKNAKLLGFNITFEQFVQLSKSPCTYCGTIGYAAKGHRDWSAYVRVNGLDRVDSNKGYLYDNVVPCCRTCNTAKSAMSREEFIAWVRKISTHLLAE